MVFETQSFLNKTATQLPINAISIQNRRFQCDCTAVNFPPLLTKALEIQSLFMF
jgi:hypothetical protein